MTEPLIVTITHRLGRDGAKERIDRGLGAIRAEIARYVGAVDYGWDGYRLDFRVSAMWQTIAGQIDVMDELVRIEIALPGLLRLLGRTIAGHVERRGAGLLEGPK